MGTRSLTMVHKNGEYKVAQYGQWDGYPEGVGCELLKFLHGIKIEQLAVAVDNVTYLAEKDCNEILERINRIRALIANYRWENDYPELSRDTGGNILDLIMFQGKKKLKNSVQFAATSSDCEWGYVIDLDKCTFEIYKGYNRNPLTEDDRFFWWEDICKEGWHPIKLCKLYDLNNLPSEEEFIADFKD